MSSPRSRTFALLAAAAVMLAALTACGDDKAPTSAEPGATAIAGTETDKAVFVDGLLDAVKAQKSAKAELAVGTTVNVTAEFNYGGPKPEARISADLLGQRIEVVVVGGQFYLKRSATGKFVRLAEDDPSLSVLGGLSDLDPKEALTAIASSIKTVREIGTETVDGDQITHFAVSVDGKELSSGMLAMMPGVDLAKDLVLDLYVDADNLVHRAEADLGENDLMLTVTDWGKPVTITAPPASEILQN